MLSVIWYKHRTAWLQELTECWQRTGLNFGVSFICKYVYVLFCICSLFYTNQEAILLCIYFIYFNPKQQHTLVAGIVFLLKGTMLIKCNFKDSVGPESTLLRLNQQHLWEFSVINSPINHSCRSHYRNVSKHTFVTL